MENGVVNNPPTSKQLELIDTLCRQLDFSLTTLCANMFNITDKLTLNRYECAKLISYLLSEQDKNNTYDSEWSRQAGYAMECEHEDWGDRGCNEDY